MKVVATNGLTMWATEVAMRSLLLVRAPDSTCFLEIFHLILVPPLVVFIQSLPLLLLIDGYQIIILNPEMVRKSFKPCCPTVSRA